ncbi:hypothetical protein MJL81_24340, partial [Salmonella enterica subsp. enterica serovar Anatum]|nr:hypothetical protein [Salmonella enterica subsp. enterica serovar Anatum]
EKVRRSATSSGKRVTLELGGKNAALFLNDLTAQAMVNGILEASQIAYELAGLRFQEGVDDYLTLLDTHRMLYGAQQRLVRTRLMQQLNIINLYKALGGGWREYSEKKQG